MAEEEAHDPPTQDEAPDGRPRDRDVCDAPLRPDACRVVAGPRELSSEYRTFPDLAWSGSRFLVVSSAAPGTELLVLTRDGAIVRREGLGPARLFPRIVMNESLGVAVATSGSGVHWIRSDGMVIGEATWNDDGTDHVDVAATSDGFVLLAGGALGRCCEDRRPLGLVRLAASPAPLRWESTDPGGPDLSVSDFAGGDGLARWLGWSVADGNPTQAGTARADGMPAGSGSITDPALAETLGVEAVGDTFWILRKTCDGAHAWLERPGSAGFMSCSGWEGAGSLVSLGDALVCVRSCWPPDDDDGIALQALDERSGQPVGPRIPIDKRGGTLLRATRTPRGLAAVWTRVVAGPVHVRQVAVFAAVDCCPQ